MLAAANVYRFILAYSTWSPQLLGAARGSSRVDFSISLVSTEEGRMEHCVFSQDGTYACARLQGAELATLYTSAQIRE